MKFFLTNKKYEAIFLFCLLLFTLFFSAYKLTESPPIWFDEANYIQVAINFMDQFEQTIQVAPEELLPATYLTAGYPLLYPLSLSFKYFGIGLLQARIVMLIFIIALVLMSYLLIRKLFGFKIAMWSSLLLATFPPLYGHGKNVMGEIPGIFFLILFFYTIYKIEAKNYKNSIYYILAGLSAGLCISSKPVFIILLPAIFLALIVCRKKINFYWQSFFYFLLAFLVPMAIRIALQYQEIQNLNESLSLYANPHGSISIIQTLINNLTRFFTEATPIYFIILLLIWIISVLIRIKNNNKILIAELIPFLFSTILLIAYLFTSGFYRYFLPANIIVLLFFPFALFVILDFINKKFKNLNSKKIKFTGLMLILTLLLLNFYQLNFKSWVASHYSSKKTLILENYFNNYSSDKSLFIYNAPEIIIFLPHRNYFQYVEFTPIVSIGKEQLSKIKAGVPDEIIIPQKILNKKIEDFNLYQAKDKIEEFVIWEKKK